MALPPLGFRVGAALGGGGILRDLEQRNSEESSFPAFGHQSAVSAGLLKAATLHSGNPASGKPNRQTGWGRYSEWLLGAFARGR